MGSVRGVDSLLIFNKISESEVKVERLLDWFMSLEEAKRFWDRAKKDKVFYEEVFIGSGNILEHMDKIKEMGYDFTKEEIHEVVVSPKVLEKMKIMAEDKAPINRELMSNLFDECNAEQLSDEQLDRVSGGSVSECKQCHEDDR